MVKPLTDAEIQINLAVRPHPDGRPWTKCCSGKGDDSTQCMCLMRKPVAAPSRFTNIMNDQFTFVTKDLIRAVITEGGRFFCFHRKTDDGYHRECAGWAAKFSKNR